MRKILMLLLLLPVLNMQAQTPAVIPEPVSMTMGKGKFTINRQTVIEVNDASVNDAVNFFNQYLQTNYGFKLAVKRQHNGAAIRFISRIFVRAPDKDAYQLTVDNKGIRIEGDTHAGTFYAVQTLIQLLPLEKSASLVIPAVSINDYPRFKYRGMMLDVSRHFFP